MIYSSFRGEKSYNGVAIFSKIPIKSQSFQNWCGLNDTRHIKIELHNNITIHNFYIPAGGDVADISTDDWYEIYKFLAGKNRIGKVSRKTNETDIHV